MAKQYRVFIKLYFLFLISRSKCELVGYVVNGDEADIRDFPYSVALHITGEDPVTGKIKYWACGSSIINQRILLSAAHCVSECKTKSNITASVGNEDRNEGTMIEVESIVFHHIFSFNTMTHDIALLKLKYALKFSHSVARVAIMKNPPYYETAYVAGWGLIDEINQVPTNILHSIDQNVWNRKRCKMSNYMSYPGVLCAQSKNTSQYSSSGDSGSAMVVRGYIQIGIVSYKYMQHSRHVVMYTDTGMLYDWIVENAQLLYCHN